MKQIDLPPDGPKKPDMLTVISTLIAAAIVLPLVWWMKENLGIAEWVNSLFSR